VIFAGGPRKNVLGGVSVYRFLFNVRWAEMRAQDFVKTMGSQAGRKEGVSTFRCVHRWVGAITLSKYSKNKQA